MAGGSALLRRRPLVIGALAVLVALAIAVTLAVTKPWASTKTRDDVAAPAAGDRVLQSVDVSMQSDGALTRVGDTVVIARAQGGKADTYTTAYDPTKVVDQLPVRVLTAYQTDKGSGTNLDDLKGYTGRLTVNLTVQNLTVASQPITYDVAGKSQTTTALVGAPLTVVASAALPGVDPATVVTAAADAPADSSADTGSTNGVLSRAQDGSTQVQWASILAPPQLDATATFRMVVDAKNFQVPTIDLSVQPGLVTDPSVGALIDSAFNPKNSSELALETRTITLIGDVNDVLGRASGTISDVRKTLDASSKTLGTKTVQSLTEDTKTISTSLKSSSDSIDSLGDDLQESLKTTQSATLQRMSETVSQLQDLIGDTSASEPTAGVTGDGCEAKVSTPGGGGGVYGDLLKVTAQLDAFANATQGCRDELQKAISDAIGTTDAQGNPVCPADTDTVVCALENAREQVSTSIASSQAAANQLDLTAIDPIQTGANTLTTQLDDVVARTNALLATDPPRNSAALVKVRDALDAAVASLAEARGSLKDLTGALDGIRGEAVENQHKVASMKQQSDDLATALCAVVGTGAEPGKLSSAQAEALRAYLVDRSCDGSSTLDLPVKWNTPLTDRLDDQEDAWKSVAAALDTSSDAHGTGRSLADLDEQLGALSDRLTTASAQLKYNQSAVGSINTRAKAADAGAKTLSSQVTTLTANYVKAKQQLDAALAQAAEANEASIKPAITQVVAESEASQAKLADAFAASADGLSSAADALRDGTAKTLKQQQDDLADQEKADEVDLSSKTKAGLSSISGSVTSATRDIDTTRTSLTKDLNNVLLDLGNPDKPDQGLLGTLGKSARAADSADSQLALASDTVSSYAGVRSQEVGGIMLRQAQAEAALQRQAELPAFATDIPATIQHRTIYLFHLGGDR